MEPGAGASNSNASAGVPSSQQYSGSVGRAPPYAPLHPTNTPLMQHAIALQQYHFQQSLLNQQLLAQQQAAANAVSIKAAAEEAAARAAQISKFLTGERPTGEKEIADEPYSNRDRFESQSRPHSPSISRSPRSRSYSRSISRSPVRYRARHSERERYSSRGYSSYRNRRYYQYGKRGYGDHYNSRQKRDFNNRYNDKDYASYHKNKSRSRSRSRGSRPPSRSRTQKHSLDRSSSQCPVPYRSRSPISDHSTERRLHRVSISPINHNSLTASPEQSNGRDRRLTGKQSLTPDSSSQNSGSRHPAGSVSRDDNGVVSLCKNDRSGEIHRHRVHDIFHHDKRLSRNVHSSSSMRSGSVSTCQSSEKVMESTKRNPKLARSAPESGNCSNSNGSNEEVVSMSLEASEDENMPIEASDQYHDKKTSQNQKFSEDEKIQDVLGALSNKREKSSEPKVERSPRSEDRECDSRSWNTPDARRHLKPTNHVKDLDYCQKVDEIKDQHLLENITEDSFNSHSRGREGYGGSGQGKADTSSEVGEDMNMYLLPYPAIGEPANGKEDYELEKADDHLDIQIASKRHGKRRSKRRSSREKRSKHGKKQHKKHKRKYSDENLKKRHGKHQEVELESDRKYHKRLKREKSEEYEKHNRRHKREDPEEAEKRHRKKHRRDNSDEDDFLDKHKSRRTMKHRGHGKHEHSYKERKRSRKHRDTSSSSEEYLSSPMSSDSDTQ
ncbi:unnamed protein product [Victoria cruziana]